MKSIRTQATGRAADHLLRLADEYGIDVADLASAAIEAAIGKSVPAASFLTRVERGELPEATTKGQFAAMLGAITTTTVVGIRLGTHDESGAQEEPWVRMHSGLDLDETYIPSIWASARGWWVVNERAGMVVAFRAGLPKALFVVQRWSEPEARRRYALDGYAVVGGRRIDPGSGIDIGPASKVEGNVENCVMGRRLVMEPQAANPIVILS